ncbi:MAG TPA: DUF3794 domain-containing protein [Thermoanaerobacterales bacterium]|nr:DUF3794 domain-containing protein [Thermoanaerobacterales bacterium]
MGVKVKKDVIKVSQVIGEHCNQAMVDGSVTVPQDKPDIEKVISVDANLNTASLDIEVIDGKVIVEGEIDLKVMYVADEEGMTQPVHFMEGTINFSTFVKIPGAKPKMHVSVVADIEYVKFSTKNQRIADVRIVLAVCAKVTKTVKIKVVTDIFDKDCQVLKELVKVDHVIGECFSQTVVKDVVEIPAEKPDIEEIIKVDVSVEEKEVKVIDNKVIADGFLVVKILYVADVPEGVPQQPVHFAEGRIPFTHFVDMPGAKPDMTAIIKVIVENARGRRRNSRSVTVEAIIELFAKVTVTEQIYVVIDAYCPSFPLELIKEKLRLDHVVGEDLAQSIIKDVLEVPPEKPDIEQIYNVKANARVVDKSIIDNKVIVEGIITIETLYVADVSEEDPQQPVHFTEAEIPFTQFVDIPGACKDMDVEIHVMVEHVNASKVNPREYEVRIVLGIFAKVTEVMVIEVVVDVKRIHEEVVVEEEEEVPEVPEKEKPGYPEKDQPTVRIYIVQANDTLWLIAKRYNTTIDAIVKANNIQDPNKISPGQKLVIP